MGSYLSNLTANRRLRQRQSRGVMTDQMDTIGDDSQSNIAMNDSDPDLSTILRYLIRRGHIRFLSFDGSDEDDEESDDTEDGPSYVRSGNRHYGIPSADPSPDTSLMDKSDLKLDLQLQIGASQKSVPSVPQLVRNREIGVNDSRKGPQYFSTSDRCKFSSRFLPSNRKITLEQYPSKAFCGFYSNTGDLFLTACQDTNIRIYDTQNGYFNNLKTIWARDVGWSVLDTDMSPDNRFFIYSSWSECIHICNIYGDSETHEPLLLAPDERRFCIFSLRFSHDGREILGGANDECLYVYDRECQNRVLKIRCHEDDVNSVSFADAGSKILFSGGDDGLCKVWDRRTLNESNPKPVGILAGHVDGITYIDSRGDGRHLITNCKDQTIKLWDMRSFSPQMASEATRKAVSKQNWDYRWQAIPRKLLSNRKKLDGDTSLMTYMGHSVLQTLIRCHFSPAWSTGQRYIYTGCSTGRVVIYDVLTGKIVKTLMGHRGCVRDVSWHPYESNLISTSWDGSIVKWKYIDENAFSSDTEMEMEGDYCGLRRSKRLAEKRRRLAQDQ